MVVLHGYGAGRLADIGTARPWVAVAIGIGYVAMLGWWVRNWMRSRSHDAFDLLLISALVAWTAWALWKRSGSTMPGLVQVWLSREGVTQVKNPTPGVRTLQRMTPWRDVSAMSIRLGGRNRARIRVIRKRSFWSSSPPAVDADVQCTPEQAEALRARISGWRAADSQGGSASKLEGGGP